MTSKVNEINTYFGRCRCCLDYGYWKNMWEEHYWEGEKEIYVEMLVQCFALSWETSEDSKECDQICESCVTQLREANRFKNTVLESQMKFLNHDDEVKAEKVDSEECKDLEIENTVDNSLFKDETYDSLCDDSDDPDFVDDNPQEIAFEEVEYLEDEDDQDSDKTPTQRHKRKKGTVPPSTSKWPKKLPTAERYKTYKQYPEENLRACLEDIRNEKMTITEAALKYNIPRKNLAAKIKYDKDDQNGTTTMEKTKSASNKKRTRIKSTIFSAKTLNIKHIRKITSNVKNKDNLVENDVIKNNNLDSKQNIEKEIKDIDVTKENIKIENNLDDSIDIKKVRSKYKAIVNANFKKEYKLNINTEKTEMNKHKNNLSQILECSNATMIKGFWGNGYSCCFCKIKKENPLELKSHNLETHLDVGKDAIKGKYVSDLVIRLDITDLKCNICNKNIDSLENFTEHIVIEHNKHMYRDIKSHIIPFKFESDVLKCVKCNKEFKYFKLLSEHMSEHFNNYQCSVCQRSFINKQSLQTHSYRHRSGVFKCSHCPKVFDTRPKKSVHERVTHTLLNKTRKCNFCDERFSTKDLVKSHETKVHGAKIPVFNCQACNKSYNSQSSLLTHRKRFHLMLRPHKCSYCDMAFYSRVELRSHTVTHTKSRDFKCDICSKSFGTRCSLNQHVRGHLDDRRFKCDVCERTFVHRTAFKVHMRSKHGKVV